MNNMASALMGIHGGRVSLCDVSVSAILHDLLFEVTVSQSYRNDDCVNIEAVYTFPLPLDAVLLDLQVEIGGRALSKGPSSRRRPPRRSTRMPSPRVMQP
jgi:Ca-activated chloride channel family protein